MPKYLLALFICLFAGAAFAQLEPMAGGWELQSITQPDGSVLTPAELGYTSELLFAEDGRYARYQDGALVHEGQWSLGEIQTMYFGVPIMLVIVETTVGDGWFSPSAVTGEALTLLSGDVEDPAEEHYIYLGVTGTEQHTLGSVRALYR